MKGLNSTFAKAEAETVQPEKADHLILPAQRVDAAFPSQPPDRYCAEKAVHGLVCNLQQLCMLNKTQEIYAPA